MKNELQQNNVAKIQGEVFQPPQYSHEIEGEQFYEMTMEVKRLSDTFDYIPVTISERILKNLNLQKGEFISVEGEYRSYNKMENDKSKLILHIFAKELETVADNEFENTVMLTGFVCKEPIYRITPFKREICDALVAVNRKNIKSDYIPCIFWGRNARFMKDVKVGSKVEIEGRIQSRVYTKTFANGEQNEKIAYEISVSKLKECEKEENQSKNTAFAGYFEESAFGKIESVKE